MPASGTEHTYTLGGPGVSVLWTISTNAAGTLVKAFRVTNQTDIKPDGNRIWTITPANEEDSVEFYAFLEAALPATASSGTEAERTRENGTVVGGGTTGGTQYILGVAGPVMDKGSSTLRKLGLFSVTVDPTSGGWIQQANNPTAPALVFKSYKNSVALTVGYALIDAITDVDGTTPLYEMGSGTETIAANTGAEIAFVTKYTP